ncbi:MAG TPA: hypothetical protein VMV86_05035 [Methanosarcinales archaeon]|nr:hypothetical protein [Methanosarcinales archaeon]
MSDKQAIRHIRDLLSHRDKWYIDPSYPDIDLFQDIVEKAKEHADYRLSSLSVNALYSRYKRWKDSEPFLGKGEDFFGAFLNQVVFDLGRDALKGNEKALYEESCYLTLHFI